MSNLHNEMILEDLFEQFLAEGHDDDTAEALALDAFDNLPEPDWNAEADRWEWERQWG